MDKYLASLIDILVGIIGALVNIGLLNEETAAKISDAIGAYGVMPIED